MLTIAAIVLARPPQLPPVTQQTIHGKWDAALLDEPRVFVMDLVDPERSVIVMAVGPGASPSVVVFSVSSVVVEQAGVVHIEAAETNGLKIKLRGRGRRLGDSGILDAQIELWGEEKFGPTTFDSQFHMLPGGFFTNLTTLVRKGEDALRHP